MTERPLTGPPCGCQLPRAHEDPCRVGHPVEVLDSCECPALTIAERDDWASRDSCPCRDAADGDL